MMENLKKLLGNDDALARRFLEIFRTELPHQLENLSQHAMASDWDEVSNCAHTIKGHLGYLSETALIDMAAAIELQAEQGGGEDLLELIKAFSAGCQQLLDKI
ncbi:MAG: Hpt domain-containing protein [Lewinellaceae bacterium]|nr:Hpt domain-containing protein [Lewinellaceae bacterium]